MVKYIPEDITIAFSEIPDEITLCINISNCQNGCIGCHSPYLKNDIGEELTISVLSDLINKNKGISCICFMGEGNDQKGLLDLALYIKSRSDYPYKVGVYSGRTEVEEFYYDVFDYVKVGPYIEKFGPLNRKTTNQILYYINDGIKNNITYRFWKNE